MNTVKYIPMFVFGTLMNQSTLDMLGVAPTEKQNATLPGFLKEGLNIIEDPSSDTPGHYFLIDERELAVLDRYEGLPTLYHRFLVNVRVGEEWKRAYAYQLASTYNV